MKIKKLLTVSVIMILELSSAFSQEGKQITLKESLQMGLNNSKTLKIANSKVNAASSKVDETKAGGLPSLKLSGSYTRLSKIDPFEILGYTVGASIFDNYAIKASAAQPIYMGNRIDAGIESAEHSKNAYDADLEKENAQLVFDIKSAYWNLRKAFDTKKSILENIDQVKAHVNDIESFERNGLATQNDVLKVKLQLSNLELNKLDAEILIETNQINFANTICAPSNSNFIPSDEANYSEINSLDLSSLKNTALSKRAELKAFDERIKSANAGVKATEAGWYPQVSAFADYLYANPNSRIQPTENKFIGTWDLGISFSYDLWNWQTTSRQVEQAEAVREQTELGLSQFKDALDLDISSSYLNLKKSYEKIAITMETIKQAEENYRTLDERFKAGAASSSELLDAETSLLQAKISYSTSLCDYEIASAKLTRTIGN